MILAMLMLACAGAEGDDKTPDHSLTDTSDFCADAPVLSWENFGQGLLIEHCQACHASDAPYREGDSAPPESVHFDTYEAAMGHRTRILAVTTGLTPTMPPRGGMSDLDLERLELWLLCGEAQ